MSLVAKVNLLADEVGDQLKADRTARGALASLTTTDKTSIVSAINEVAGAVAGAGAQINDAATSGSSVWSSSKTSTEISAAITATIDGAPGALDTLNEIAAALQDNPDVISNILSAQGTNTSDIATNAADIATNAADIATNAAAIGAEGAADFVATFTAALA